MTPRSLFSIIIKTIALYILIGSLSFVPQLASTLIYYFQPRITDHPGIGEIIISLLVIVVIIGFYILFFRLCFFKTDWIIQKLRLDQGFEEEKLDLNIHRSDVLKIAVMITGALIISDSLPLFLKNLISYVQMHNNNLIFNNNLSPGWLIYYFVKFAIGLFLLTASRLVVNFIELKRKA